MEVISRDYSKENGLKYYFTGKPCKHGHITERWTSNKECLGCYREFGHTPSKWYKKDPEKNRANVSAWRKNNPEKVKIQKKRAWDNLTLPVVKSRMIERTNIRYCDIPEELARAKQIQLQIKRSIKELQNEKHN